MKLSVSDPKDFRAVAGLVLKVADAKIPAAQYMLIEAHENGEVNLYATNLDISIKRTVLADVEEAGAICVPATKMATVLKNLDKAFTLKNDTNDWIKIKSGKYNGRIPAINSQHFPQIEEVEEFSLAMQSDDLKEMIESTVFAVTNEETRYTLNGIKLEFSEGVGRMIATDGARVAYIEKEIDGDIDTLLPKKSLEFLTKLEKGIVQIENTANHLFFKTEDTLLISKKISGSFPNYHMITEFELDHEFSLDLVEFKKAVNRVASTVDNDVINSLKFTVSENSLKLENNSSDMGYAEEELDMEYQGDQIEFTLNSAFIRDFLNSTSKPKVHIKFKDSNSVVTFNFGYDNYKLCMMPLRTR